MEKGGEGLTSILPLPKSARSHTYTHCTHAHTTHMHTLHTCTHYTHAHTTHMHTLHTCTHYTHAHTTHMHTLHTCTHYTHAHTTHMHTLHTCTHYTHAHTTHMHTLHTCTLHTCMHCTHYTHPHTTHMHTLHTCTHYTHAHTTHMHTLYTHTHTTHIHTLCTHPHTMHTSTHYAHTGDRGNTENTLSSSGSFQGVSCGRSHSQWLQHTWWNYDICKSLQTGCYLSCKLLCYLYLHICVTVGHACVIAVCVWISSEFMAKALGKKLRASQMYIKFTGDLLNFYPYPFELHATCCLVYERLKGTRMCLVINVFFCWIIVCVY